MLVPSSFLHSLLRFVRDRYPDGGGFPEPVSRGRALPDEDVERSFEALIESTGDQDLGLHFGHSDHAIEAYGVAGLLFRASASIREALQVGGHYGKLLASQVVRPFEHTAEGLVFRIGPPRVHMSYRQLHEAVFASYVYFIRVITDGELRVLRADFAHPPPTSLETHHLVFSGATLRFGQSIPQVVLPREVVDRPVVCSDPVTLRFLRGIADQELEGMSPTTERAGDDLEQIVRAELRGTGRMPPLAVLAQRLALSERTLQRRLTDQGRSYRAIVDDVRRAEALRLIDEPGLTIEQIAARIDLDGPRSLRRAVKRWTGTTTGRLRKQRQQPEPETSLKSS